jgi:hypothetical protein
MANELSSNGNFRFTKGGLTTSANASFVATVTGQVCAMNQVATTSWVALNTPAAIAAIARIFVKNEDATNFIELSTDSGGSPVLCKLVAGEFNSISLPAAVAALYVRADTASCNVSFIVVEP